MQLWRIISDDTLYILGSASLTAFVLILVALRGLRGSWRYFKTRIPRDSVELKVTRGTGTMNALASFFTALTVLNIGLSALVRPTAIISDHTSLAVVINELDFAYLCFADGTFRNELVGLFIYLSRDR